MYVYDAFGQLAAEYAIDTSGSPTGRRYLTADHLGSTRAIWKTDGTADVYCDYAPFGSNIGDGIGGRTALWNCGANNTVKFTGKERDAETGLDFVESRYFSSAQGRFTSRTE